MFEVDCLHQHTVISLYRLDRNGKILKYLRILIIAVYFKDRNWLSKAVYCIIFSVDCKIVFCSEFSDILDKPGRVTRRRTHAIAKRYAFHANAIISLLWMVLHQLERKLDGAKRLVNYRIFHKKEFPWPILAQCSISIFSENVRKPLVFGNLQGV